MPAKINVPPLQRFLRPLKACLTSMLQIGQAKDRYNCDVSSLESQLLPYLKLLFQLQHQKILTDPMLVGIDELTGVSPFQNSCSV